MKSGGGEVVFTGQIAVETQMSESKTWQRAREPENQRSREPESQRAREAESQRAREPESQRVREPVTMCVRETRLEKGFRLGASLVHLFCE